MLVFANIFQNGMTFQRQKPIKIWGVTDTKQTVFVKINGEIVVEDILIFEKFELVLPAMEAAESSTIIICGNVDTVVFENIDIGEVWIAGGQSNMEFPLRYDKEFQTQIVFPEDIHLRFYDVPKYAFQGEEEDGLKDARAWNRWMNFDKANSEYFSAVGYYFARKIKEKYRVPVAIIGCNWGGTSASTWIRELYLRRSSALLEYINEYELGLNEIHMETYESKNLEARKIASSPEAIKYVDKLLKGHINKISMILINAKEKKTTQNAIGPHDANRPGALYHMMLKQIIGFSCRGVIWYQGESDVSHAKIYSKLFSEMINCWRDDWKENLPFLFVQLAPFARWLNQKGEDYPILRNQQEWVSKNTLNTYMASIMDVGMKKDIHPKKKRVVGERLALLALGKVYGEAILCEPPECIEIIHKNESLEVKFKNIGDELIIKGKRLNALHIFTSGKEIKKYKVSVRGNTLIINSKRFYGVKLNVRFAYTDFCIVNLYNSSNLSANPFSWDE